LQQPANATLSLTVEAKLREREAAPDLWLCQALIKKDRLDWIAEKSCELGIARFVPGPDAALRGRQAEGRKAAQPDDRGCRAMRTHRALPEIAELSKLDALLRDWPADRTLLFCDERGGNPLSSIFCRQIGPSQHKAAILIGPEGGFSDEENAAIRALPQAIARIAWAQISCAPTPRRLPELPSGWR
jgi:16S rRNA (uracil1498-N3)-methyltransferase